MNSFNRTLGLVIRGTGLFQVLLGLVFWAGYARPLTPLHMLVGLLFVLALWVLAVRAFAAGASRGFAAFLALWGAVVLVFGMTQARILPGPYHWVIQVLHLLVGGLAMGFARSLGERMRKAAAPRAGAGAAPLVRALGAK